MPLLLLKATLAPSLIGLASWIESRWGPTIGGVFTALPLTSGPVVLVLAFERGPSFAATASVGALLALISLCGFALAYSWSSRSLRWTGSSLLGCAAYLVCTVLLQRWSITFDVTLVTVCGILLACVYAMPLDSATKNRSAAPAWDIPVRMIVAAILAVGITTSAPVLGPKVSGLLTPFPVAATILAAFIHHFDGYPAAREFLRGLLKGLFSFAVFFLVIGILIERWSIGATFAMATVATMMCQAALWARIRSAEMLR